MAVLKEFVVVLHLLGMAAIVGPYLLVRAHGRIDPVMVWGARAQILTGLVLVAFAEMGERAPNHLKIGVKLGIAVAVVACTEMAAVGQKKRVAATHGQVPDDGFGSVGSLVDAAAWLTVLNVLVAVMWRSYG